MSDLTTRLREHADIRDGSRGEWHPTPVPLMREAAARIEALEAVIAEALAALRNRAHTRPDSLMSLLEETEASLSRVPQGAADQRTADHEMIARALWDSRYPAIEWDYAISLTENAGLVARLAGCRKDADAVLAVLVPAEQVRAETLREAHAIISKRQGTYEAGIDLMERVAELEAGATRG